MTKKRPIHLNNIKKLIRSLLFLIADTFCINLSSFLALFSRYEFSWKLFSGEESFQIFLYLILPNTFVILILFSLLHLYQSLWAYASIEEIERIAAIQKTETAKTTEQK